MLPSTMRAALPSWARESEDPRVQTAISSTFTWLENSVVAQPKHVPMLLERVLIGDNPAPYVTSHEDVLLSRILDAYGIQDDETTVKLLKRANNGTDWGAIHDPSYEQLLFDELAEGVEFDFSGRQFEGGSGIPFPTTVWSDEGLMEIYDAWADGDRILEEVVFAAVFSTYMGPLRDQVISQMAEDADPFVIDQMYDLWVTWAPGENLDHVHDDLSKRPPLTQALDYRKANAKTKKWLRPAVWYGAFQACILRGATWSEANNQAYLVSRIVTNGAGEMTVGPNGIEITANASGQRKVVTWETLLDVLPLLR